jgi:hypothetical protein
MDGRAGGTTALAGTPAAMTGEPKANATRQTPAKAKPADLKHDMTSTSGSGVLRITGDHTKEEARFPQATCLFNVR